MLQSKWKMAKTNNNSKQILAAVFEFNESCNVIRLKKTLRNMLLDYIAQNKDCLPLDFDRQLYDLGSLFNLLDIIEGM